MTLPRFLTTVTPFSKYLAILVCITLPFIGFLLGVRYQEIFTISEKLQEETDLLIEQPTPTPDETANWKTYKNMEIGFSFKYPQELNYIYDENMKDAAIRKTGQLLIQNFDGSKPVDIKDSLKTQIHLTVGKNMIFSLEQHVNNQQKFMREYGKTLPSSKEIMVDSEQAFKGGTIQKGEVVPAVWFKHKEFDYTLAISPETSTNISLFDQILSTFRFLN